MTRRIQFNRRLLSGQNFVLGTAREDNFGWRFTPSVSGRSPSRKSHSTLEKCLPRWLGYPDQCESEEVGGKKDAV